MIGWMEVETPMTLTAARAVGRIALSECSLPACFLRYQGPDGKWHLIMVRNVYAEY